VKPLVDPISPLRREPRAAIFDLSAGAAVLLAALAIRLVYVFQLRATPLFGEISLDPAY
jgi:hypothetical protein